MAHTKAIKMICPPNKNPFEGVFIVKFILLMHSFSQELISKIIKYFKEKHNHEISEETAIEYLESLARLFNIFRRSISENQTNLDIIHEDEQGTTPQV
jgi:hypothetical protein